MILPVFLVLAWGDRGTGYHVRVALLAGVLVRDQLLGIHRQLRGEQLDERLPAGQHEPTLQHGRGRQIQRLGPVDDYSWLEREPNPDRR